MPVNETIAHYSTWAYGSAIGIYVLAMLLCLAESAFGRAKVKAVAPAAAVLVTAGAGDTETVDLPDVDGAPIPEDEPVDGVRGRRPLPERLGRMGVALVVLGLLVHATAIVLRGVATDRPPWGNMYEYMSVLCFVALAAWAVLLRKFPIRRATGFVLLPIVILLFLGGTVLYTQAEPVEPALQSYWLAIHVSAAASASGILLVPGVASVLYLIRTAYDRNPNRFAKFGPKLPAAATLDRLAYRTTIFGFPLFTFGVICGAIWAESAWGRFWGWDPKETTAFVAWVVYAAYLHSRATAGWRGQRAAIINALGFCVMIFNLFFVNLVTTGLHSYAGVG
jgi:cytochrome c-type biogenesis protein CcsB